MRDGPLAGEVGVAPAVRAEAEGSGHALPLWTIPAGAVMVGLLFYAVHLQAEWWLEGNPGRMGALRTRHILPLIARRGRSFGPWLVPALVVLGGYFLAARALFLRRTVSTAGLLAASAGLFFAIGTSVAMIDGYITAYLRGPQPAVLYPYTQPFASYADVPKVEEKGAATFLRNFSKRYLNDNMANHTRTHPPGPTLFLWGVSRVMGPGLVPAWLATVLCAALGVIPVYFIGRELHGDEVARVSLALFLLVPSIVMFSSTSMDGPMTAFLLLAVWTFLRAVREGARAWPLEAALAGLAMALASFMTYTVVFLLLLFTVMAALALAADRALFLRILRVVPVAALVCAAFYGALYLWAGYDPIAAAQRAVWANNELVGTGHATREQYFEVSVANLFAFLFGMSFALVALWLRGIRAAARSWREEAKDPFPLAFPIALLVITFAALYTLETERIWMFMAPMLTLPAARFLVERRRAGGGEAAFHWTAALMALQLVLAETYSDTLW